MINISVDTSEAEKYLVDMEDSLINDLIPYIIQTLAVMVATNAKDYTVPVRTGRLQESIRVERKGQNSFDVVAGGINIRGVLVNYAYYVEYGTRHFVGRFYMHTALNNIMVNFDSIVEAIKRGERVGEESGGEVDIVQ